MPITTWGWSPGPGPCRKALLWFVHYSQRFVLVLGAAIFVTQLAKLLLNGQQKALWPIVVILVLIPFWVTALVGSDFHTVVYWCNHCTWKKLAESADEAEKKRWQLRFFHLQQDHPVMQWLIRILFLVGIVVTNNVAGVVVFTGWLITTVVRSRTVATHGRYQMVCPWCDDDGDGDIDVLPAPAPIESHR